MLLLSWKQQSVSYIRPLKIQYLIAEDARNDIVHTF